MLKIRVCSLLENVLFTAGCFALLYFFFLWLEERNELINALHKAVDSKIASQERDEAKK